MKNETIRWKSRFNGDFHPKYIEFIDLISKQKEFMEKEVFDVEFCMFFVTRFMKLFFATIKVLREFMQYQGIFQVDAREVIKESFSIEIIEDVQGWIDMMYDVNRFQTKIPEKEDLELIINKYFILISKINEYLEKKYGE